MFFKINKYKKYFVVECAGGMFIVGYVFTLKDSKKSAESRELFDCNRYAACTSEW